MNDLIIPSQLSKRFPRLEAIIKQAQGLFDSIHSFEDLERHFLKGNGLSPNTYRSYLTAIKQFYEYTNGLNPLQSRPADIESFYDHLVQAVDRNKLHI